SYAAQMQDEMMNEIETAHPKYVVYVRIGTSWMAHKRERILDWSVRYLEACYNKVGIADVYSQADTKMLCGADVIGYQPRSQKIVDTYHRKSSATCAVAR